VDKGVSSGRVWTAQELKQFPTMADLGSKDFQVLAELKFLFGGEFLPDNPEDEGRWLTPKEFFGPGYSDAMSLLRTGQKPPDVPCHGCRGQEWWRGKDGQLDLWRLSSADSLEYRRTKPDETCVQADHQEAAK
jgi:hypothetical protein